MGTYPSAEKLDTSCVTMFCIAVMTPASSVFRSASATELSPSQQFSTFVCGTSGSPAARLSAGRRGPGCYSR
jgi:hypothetical protein